MVENNQVNDSGTVIFLGSDVVGRGDNAELGTQLMQNFLHTLAGTSGRPSRLLLMNNGVRMVTHDSPVIGQLKILQELGVEILVCGTCLSRFGLTDKIAVGQVSNMYIITETMLKAKKVISL